MDSAPVLYYYPENPLEKIGKAFSVPLGYFCDEETPSSLLNLLLSYMKNLIHDRQALDLLRLSRRLSKRDLSLVMQIVSILVEGKPIPDVAGGDVVASSFISGLKRP